MEQVFKALCNFSDTHGDLIPYALIQPRMRNRKEYKVVLFNCHAQYVADISTGSNHKGSIIFSHAPHSELVDFAVQAALLLSKTCSFFICDGIVRIDVFQTMQGKLVVNEVESLEANYSSRNHLNQLRMRNLLDQYWHSILSSLIFSYKIKSS